MLVKSRIKKKKRRTNLRVTLLNINVVEKKVIHNDNKKDSE